MTHPVIAVLVGALLYLVPFVPDPTLSKINEVGRLLMLAGFIAYLVH